MFEKVRQQREFLFFLILDGFFLGIDNWLHVEGKSSFKFVAKRGRD